MIHDVLYVPGLGDKQNFGQRLLVQTWRLWGVRPTLVEMKWSEGVHFAPKLQQLVAVIDNLHARGHRVSLVGASAAGSAVLNAYAQRKDVIAGVVLLAGWVNFPDQLGTGVRRSNPAFVESAYAVPASLDALKSKTYRSRIQSRYGLIDHVVRQTNSLVPGADNKKVFGFGHAVTIASQLVFGAPFFLRFLKKNEK